MANLIKLLTIIRNSSVCIMANHLANNTTVTELEVLTSTR